MDEISEPNHVSNIMLQIKLIVYNIRELCYLPILCLIFHSVKLRPTTLIVIPAHTRAIS